MTRALSRSAYAGAACALIAAALALRWPMLHSGFIVDDYAQLAMMRGQFPLARAPLQLFTFSSGGFEENRQLRAAGFFPWWSDPHLRVSLFRPLSSALMWFDRKHFRADAFLYHLHSAAWWLLMMGFLAWVLRRILQPWPALLALALCCTLSAHGMFLGWIANRNACICSAFCLLGLLINLRFGIEAARVRVLGVACFAIGLSAGEYALGFISYPLALAWFSARSPKQRVMWTMPWVLLLAMYLPLRAALGYGTHGSGMYIDAFGEPLALFRASLVRAPISIGEMVTGVEASWWSGGFPWARTLADARLVPASWANDMRPFQEVQVALGVLAAAVALWIAREAWREREHRWLIAAAALAFLPSLASMSESRILLPAFVGWSAIVARRLQHQLELLRAQPIRSAAIATVTLMLLIVPTSCSWPTIHGMPALMRAVRASLLDPRLDQLIAGRRVLLISAADPTTTIYLPLVRRVHDRPSPKASLLLSSSAVDQRLLRTSVNSFVLERLRPDLTALDIYASGFNRQPLRDGEQFEAGGMHVRVERALDGRAMRTRYELDASLDSPEIVLLFQTAQGLEPLAFPPVGASTIVGPPVPPFAFDGRVTDAGG